MQAITRTQYGSVDVLKIKTIKDPIPKEDEVLVKIKATTVNRTDCGILTGKPFLIRFFTGLIKPKFLVPGTDFAGEVVALGKKARLFKVGQRVWGLNDEGLQSHAQYMTIKENQAISLIPKGVRYQDCVAFAEGGHYAYNFINKVRLKKGTKILVNGATGAIGSAAVQLLKFYGAIVTAVGNTKNQKLLQSLQADKVIDYLKEDFTKESKKIYHFIFDAVGKSSFGRCRHLLARKGVYISSELGPYAQNLYLPLFTKIFGTKRVIFPIPFNCKKSIAFFTQLFESGKLKGVIDQTYAIKHVKEAYAYVSSGQKTGSVLLDFETFESNG